jgi:hypothetical protein
MLNEVSIPVEGAVFCPFLSPFYYGKCYDSVEEVPDKLIMVIMLCPTGYDIYYRFIIGSKGRGPI